jgi:Txe/YoeB family toxin of toxin-antitoxin system
VRGIAFVPDAWDAYLYWQQQDRKTLKRINTLITDAAREPFTGIGKPEPLRGRNMSMFLRQAAARFSVARIASRPRERAVAAG